MGDIRLATRLFRREWRCGELRILALALLIAVTVTTCISFFTDRLSQALLNRSAEMLGGDLVVRGTRPLDPGWLSLPEAVDLKRAEITEFSTVVIHQEQLLLANVKAVGSAYPLYGSLQISEDLYDEAERVDHPPQPGTLWVDRRVLDRLQLKVGDRVAIGASDFRIGRVLLLEPDRGGNYFNLAPRILMNHQDLAKAQVLQAGSRANYKIQFAGDPDRIARLKARLTLEMSPGYRLMSAGEGRQGAGLVLKRAQDYLALTALLSIILAAVAIAVAARRYSQRHYDVSALLGCLGASQKKIFRLYLIQLVLLALVCGGVGTLLGWVTQRVLANVLQEALNLMLPASGWQPWIMGVIASLVVLFGTALPPLWRLKQVPPLRVIRRDLKPLPLKGWLVYGCGWLAFCLLILLFTQAFMLLLAVFAGLLALIGVFAGVVWLLMLASKGSGLANAGLPGRGLSRVIHRSRNNTLQITAFALTLMLMTVVAMLRTELLANWSMQVTDDVPNHFVFNIMPADKTRLHDYLLSQGIVEPRLYPMVRGRLVKIKGVDINAEFFPEKDEAPSNRSRNGINRELNLSWTDRLPVENQVVSGQWWTGPLNAGNGFPEVSVEVELAKRLGIDLQDQLEFDIAGQRLTAQVTSLRSLVWESFTPNFYMLFSPGSLDAYPTTYITSFRLEKEDRQTLIKLVHAFPSITVLEVDALIEQLQRILEQVTALVELMLAFVLLAGLCVLLAIIQSELDERLREGALMRALGASRRYLRALNRLEFAFMGLLAGVLAVAGAELATALIYQRIFDLPPHWHWPYWFWVPLLSTLTIGLAGQLATDRTVSQSPMLLLKQYD